MTKYEDQKRAHELRDRAEAVRDVIRDGVPLPDVQADDAKVVESVLAAMAASSPWIPDLEEALRERELLTDATRLANKLDLGEATRDLSDKADAIKVSGKWPDDFDNIGRKSDYLHELRTWAALELKLADLLVGSGD